MKTQTYLSKIISYSYDWFRSKFISEAEFKQIQEYIDEKRKASRPSNEKLWKKLVNMLFIMSFSLILAGVIYFFAANWKGFDKFIKVLIIVIGMGLFYGGSVVLMLKITEHPLLYKLCAFGGTLFFGIGLALIGQTYNIHANSYLLFSIWLIPTITLAFLINFEPYFTLSIILYNLAIIGFMFPDFRIWDMDEYPMVLYFTILILVNLAPFFLRIILNKLSKGYTAMYIGYVIAHFCALWITFKGLSDEYVFLINGLYIVGTILCFVFFFRVRPNKFFIFFTLIFFIFYLFCKYIEILIYRASHGGFEDFLIFLILLGIVITPVIFVLIKVVNKLTKRVDYE